MALHGVVAVGPDGTRVMDGAASETQAFECEECDTQFLRQSNLEKHRLAVHGSERRIVVITGSGRRLVGPDVKVISVLPAEEPSAYIDVKSE